MELRRVLFIDDDPLISRVFARQVRQFGIEADTAQSAGEGVLLARKQMYPVIATDLLLPTMDGFAVIDALGAMSPESVFMIVSGSTVLREDRLKDEGSIAAFISKPWDVGDLEAKLTLAYDLYERKRSAAAQSPSATSVLVIEDTATDALVMRRLLGKIPGVTVQMASTLNEGVQLLHDRPYDVVMTDLSLPDSRGVDAVFRLRTSAPDSAIVVCSGVEEEALTLQLIQLGAQELLSKRTLDLESLSRAVRFARERKRAELRLARTAYYDPLTGLANRSGWQNRTGTVVAQARRLEKKFAVLVLDLDGFKGVNDFHGHDAGDALLQQIGERIQRTARVSDVAARLGGDEFAIVLADVPDADTAEAVAMRYLTEITKPITLPNGEIVTVGCSIGLSMYPRHGDNMESLSKSADQAMYAAKSSGKNRIIRSDA